MKFLAWVRDWPGSVKLAVLFAVLFVVFAFLNGTRVTIHLGFGRLETPMYVALSIAAILGLVPGFVFGHWRARKKNAGAKGAEKGTPKSA